MAATGQGWEQIRSEWDIPRTEAWNRYTADHPPLNLMVAAYLGIKPNKASASDANAMLAEVSRTGAAVELPVHPRAIRRDLMPWLTKT